MRNHDEGMYDQSARWNIANVDKHVSLRPDMDILEIGCAAGRLARPLLDFLKDGSYEGIEINPGAVAWASEHITSRWPNFTFRHVDVRHPVVNPGGTLEAEGIGLELERNYDLVMLHSVFTHMLPDAVRGYVEQIAQALKPDGYLYASAFVWDSTAEESYAAGVESWKFDHDLGDALVVNPELPEWAVALKSDFLFPLMTTNGLKLHAEVQGSWRQGNKPSQDVLIFRR